MVRLCETMTGDHPARPVLVLSNRPGAGGLAKAKALGVPTRTVDHQAFPDRATFEASVTAALEDVAAEVICLAGFMRILTPEFANRWAGQILNIHPSLLPKYPGLNTHARAIEAEDTEAGCTVHLVTPVLDDGPILGQAKVPVIPGDTAQTLARRVLDMEHQLYPAVLRRFVEREPRPLYLP